MKYHHTYKEKYDYNSTLYLINKNQNQNSFRTSNPCLMLDYKSKCNIGKLNERTKLITNPN